MKKQSSIIIKKVKKVQGGGHHGGAWKVAYADFVTAMMAFFLLLWLLNMSSPEKRIRLSTYFKTYSIFTTGGTSMMGAGSQSLFSESGQNAQKAMSDYYGDANSSKGGQSKDKGKEDEKKGSIDLSKLSASLKDDIEAASESEDKSENGLGDIEEQISIDISEGGVRIELTDTEGSNMFKIGSSKLTPKAKKVFKLISKNLNPLPNVISVEGHTDAVPYSGREYGNWELSTERALVARKELEINGLNHIRFASVSGYAGTKPLYDENSLDARNRRISIVIKDEVIPELVKDAPEDVIKKPVAEVKVKKGDNGKSALRKIKESQDIVVEDGTGESTASKESTWKPVTNNGDQTPLIDSVISPINNEETSNPVIDNEWKPVIDMNNGQSSKKKPKITSKLETEQKPSTVNKESKSTQATSIKNRKDYISKKIREKSSQKKQRIIEKDTAETKNKSGEPVRNNNGWNPVLNTEGLNPFQ